MSGWLKQTTAATIMFGPFLDNADGTTVETALTPPIEISKNGGSWGARSDGTSAAHAAEGFYTVTFNTVDTNTVGRLQVKSVDGATHLPVWDSYMVLPPVVHDSLVGGSDFLHVDVTAWANTAPNVLISGRVDASASAVGDKTGYSIGTTGISNVSFTASAAATIADAVWDEVLETRGPYTGREIVAIVLSVLAGVTSSSGSVFSTPDGGGVRVTATLNSANERTAMTLAPGV